MDRDAMNRDRSTWANPIRAQMVVAELEERLGTEPEASAIDSADSLDSSTDSREPPD